MTDGPAVTHRVQKGYQAMTHSSLIAKPFMSVADLHLFGKYLMGGATRFTQAERDRCDNLYEDLCVFLDEVVGPTWEDREALVP
jgi:hypothetical protein